MAKFKVGDKLICKPGFPKGEDGNSQLGGAGYEEGTIVIVERMTSEDSSNPVYWPGINNCGVYERALQYLVSPVINDYSIY